MGQFEVVARMKVRAGMLEQFKKQAAECIRQAAVKDIGTLRYDWFLSRDGRSCEVREVYADSESLLQHRSNVGGAVDRLIREFADEPITTAYGESSPQLLRLKDTLGPRVTWYSLFRGLAALAPRD